MVYAEISGTSPWIIDLVIKNFGLTAATDIRVQFTPEPVRAIDRHDGSPAGLIVPDPLPVLVPGQEWRTLWDSAIERFETGDDDQYPRHYEATVSFCGSDGREPSLTHIVDLRAIAHREWTTEYGVHHAAEALRT